LSLAPAAEALIRQISEGKASSSARSAAARGVLPFPRVVLAHLFVLLLRDEDENICGDAAASLAGLDDDALREILTDTECSPEVLLYFTQSALKDEIIAERIIFHPEAPVQALEILSAKGNSSAIELVLTNQERLLASPAILDRLIDNPALRTDQRGRLLELLDRVARMQGEGAAADTEAVEETEFIDAEEAARILDIDVGELFTTSEIMGGDEFETSDVPEIRSAYKRILVLTTGQRAILAMKGGREERMILIRDTNKIVALSVLKNQRIPDGEVESIAMMRNVSEDVLRAIGANREWAKNYAVATALVRNPRTPPGISTNFISRLQSRDLKMLAKDRNVPEIIRRMSKKTPWMQQKRNTSL